jgi:hypothetical protein
MNNFESAVGSPAKIYFSSTPGRTINGAIVLNGIAVVPGPILNIFEITNGLYVADYLPTSTGTHCVYVDGQVIARIEVVQKTSQTILKNLEDEALGSWQWDKQACTLTMIRQDGTELAKFNVKETLELALRERA